MINGNHINYLIQQIFFKGNLLAKSDLDDNGSYLCILYGQLYTKYNQVIREIESKTNRNEKNIPRSNKGDVLIPSSGETPIDISTSSCVQFDNVLLGGDINILRPINCDGRFLSYTINNNKKTEIANREIPINKDFMELLKPLKTDKDNYILYNNDKYIEPITYRKYFNKILKE